MGQIISAFNRNKVSDPKTPYEYRGDEPFMSKKDLTYMIDSIQEQLDADARVVEKYILEHGICYFNNNDHLRIKLDPVKYKNPYVILPVDLRLECLFKNIKKITFTYTLVPGRVCLSRVFNAVVRENSDLSVEASPEPLSDNRFQASLADHGGGKGSLVSSPDTCESAAERG